MPLELYLDLNSQPCRSVFLFAKINKIPFEFKAVDLSAGEQYGDEFGKVSIIRKVPVLKDGDFILTESIAILQYLAAKHHTPDHWYPAELQKRARVDEFLSWQHTNIRTHGSKVFWFRVRVLSLSCFVLSLMHAFSEVELTFPNSRGFCLSELSSVRHCFTAAADIRMTPKRLRCSVVGCNNEHSSRHLLQTSELLNSQWITFVFEENAPVIYINASVHANHS
uniref:Glutathione S-transferase theta 1a n=1 Tax=Sinocyclocheilus rhinocerous TaxID=307959 RepID=A0A673GTF3_9TELE